MSSKGEMDRVPATAIPTLENSGRLGPTVRSRTVFER